jgi:hypothetical protein
MNVGKSHPSTKPDRRAYDSDEAVTIIFRSFIKTILFLAANLHPEPGGSRFISFNRYCG